MKIRKIARNSQIPHNLLCWPRLWNLTSHPSPVTFNLEWRKPWFFISSQPQNIIDNKSRNILSHQSICLHCRDKAFHTRRVVKTRSDDGILKRYPGESLWVRVKDVGVVPGNRAGLFDWCFADINKCLGDLNSKQTAKNERLVCACLRYT